MQKGVAIIPARGGSKRIPKKNIKDFCGKPIIAYSIEAVLNSNLYEEVMVSTDSEEIAEIATKYGAKVPFYRSKEMADDFATTAQVIMEVLRKYRELGKNYDYALCLYPTAPFVSPEILKRATWLMEKENPDEIIGVVEFSYPPQRCYSIGEDGLMAYKYKEYINTRSQDLERLYHDAGQFYIYNSDALFRCDGKIKDGILPMIIPPLLVQDIDTEDDWILAEAKYSILKQRRGC